VFFRAGALQPAESVTAVMDLYVTRKGQQLGPYSIDEANRNLRGGVISSFTF
jgi:hypothetical protein